jgi:hypothetical protein
MNDVSASEELDRQTHWSKMETTEAHYFGKYHVEACRILRAWRAAAEACRGAGRLPRREAVARAIERLDSSRR